ncbi:MAG: DNA polymerase I [Desulfuromonadaceae bacterium]|nr:DNA polymerase I [Desulfuromonadaceae bacterium]
MSPPLRTYLIDGSSYIYRAFYALPHLSTREGIPTNAVYGFVTMLLKIIREEKPDRLAVVFDARGPTFRKQIYPEYKANRKEMPAELVPQIPLIKEAVRVFNLAALEKEGFEADDVIATVAGRLAAAGEEITVVSGDKDLMQIIGDKVRMLDTMKNKVFGLQEVAERFGGSPETVVEVLALAGDSSDNVPGVPGIGEKTARELIAEFGDVEKLLASLDRVKGAKRRENLERFADQARLSRRLVTLEREVPLDLSPDELELKPIDLEMLAGFFRKLEFHTLLAEFSALTPPRDADYRAVVAEAELERLLETLRKASAICLDTETTSLDAVRADLVGISLSVKENEAFYIPVGHVCEGGAEQLDRELVVGKLRPLLEDETISKVGQNLKYDALVLRRAGLRLRGIAFDTMLASYLTDAGTRSHSLDRMALDLLGHKMISYEAVTGGKKKSFATVPIDRAAEYSCEDADITLRLMGRLRPRLAESGLEKLFNEVEMPLLAVLAEMEWNGIGIDSKLLAELSRDLEGRLSQLTEEIYRLAGAEFNIASPKQLGEVLFEKLKLPRGRKTKTGWSTDVEVLTHLAEEHEICARILDYRSVAKLKSTYADALPQIVNPETGRIHTSFNQSVTVTGRLSSSEPNLQNIPVRTAEGKRIREAFIPGAGCLLLSADYSQVELRILAHMAQEEVLRESFRRGEDIHRRTAGEVFGLAPEAVTHEQRRQAKAINFGIIYGMSAFGLSRQLGIGRQEAQEYIDRYFERYPRIREFMEACINEARQKRYVTTLLGRRCPVPDIDSKNGAVRGNAERNAINYPIQGSAADIIKLAMIRIHRRLEEGDFRSRMVLQVHDELLFEVPEGELIRIEELVRREMEGAVSLDVPLAVELGSGSNWSAAH